MKTNRFPLRTTLCRLAVVLAIPTFLCACSDSSDVTAQNNASVDTEEALPPTIDSLKVKTYLKTYVFQHGYDNTGLAFVNRVTDPADALDSTVQTVVLHDGVVEGLTENDYQAVAAHVASGNAIVYCAPTRVGFSTFVRNLKAVGMEMFGRGELQITEGGYDACRQILNLKEDSVGMIIPPTLADGDTNGILCDIIALRGDDSFVVTDMDEDKSIQVTEMEEENGVETAVNSSTEEATDLPLEYMYGIHADRLATWLATPADKEASLVRGRNLLRQTLANGDMNLDEVAQSTKREYSFNAYAGHKFEPVTITYEIWTVHANDDTNADYYLVHQDIWLENSKLKCGPTDTYKWNTYKVEQAFGKGKVAYWAYMTGMVTNVEFIGANPKMDHVSPTNDTKGVTSFTEGSSWSLSGALINPSLSGSVTMQKSWSYNVADLGMSFTKNTNKPRWEYKAGTKPKANINYDEAWHTNAKEILCSDCNLGHSWIWRVDKADKTYSFKTNIDVSLEGLWVRIPKKGSKTFTSSGSVTFTLPVPPRYQQQWIMTVDPYDTNLRTFVNDYLKDEWQTSFSINTVDKNDRKNIDLRIADLTGKLEGLNKQHLLKNDSIGTFTLTWQLYDANTKAYSTYKTYTCTPK